MGEIGMLLFLVGIPFSMAYFTFLTIKAAIEKDKNFNTYAITASLIFAVTLVFILSQIPVTR